MPIDMTTSSKVSTSSLSMKVPLIFSFIRSPNHRVQIGHDHNVAFISRLTANMLQFSYTISDINILDINIQDRDSVAKNQRCFL